MLRVVLDTNVLVSSTIHARGPSRQILEAVRAGHFTLLLSPFILVELNRALRYPRIVKRYNITEDDIHAVNERLLSVATILSGNVRVPDVIKDDPTDNAILACADEGAADYIVSGNRHLLDVGRYLGIPIVTPRKFLDFLEQPD